MSLVIIFVLRVVKDRISLDVLSQEIELIDCGIFLVFEVWCISVLGEVSLIVFHHFLLILHVCIPNCLWDSVLRLCVFLVMHIVV